MLVVTHTLRAYGKRRQQTSTCSHAICKRIDCERIEDPLPASSHRPCHIDRTPPRHVKEPV